MNSKYVNPEITSNNSYYKTTHIVQKLLYKTTHKTTLQRMKLLPIQIMIEARIYFCLAK